MAQNTNNDMMQDIQEVLLSEEKLQQIVRDIGAQISKDYAGKNC